MVVEKLQALETPDADSVTLSAVSFVAGGRKMVRLVPEALLAAETVMQTTLGFLAQDAQPVARVQPRALGFPAWPIITDPDNARFALNLVSDLEWARKHASSSAKKVRDRFDDRVGDLTRSAPHFVPTLLEELARIFIAVRNYDVARKYFNRAREVERSYGISIDPARHEAALLEFALSGVVGPKELTRAAKDTPEFFEDPARAFDAIVRINVNSLRAGQPLYPGVLRDLRKLGTLAGLSSTEADARFFDSMIEFRSIIYAPAGFWKTAQASLAFWLRDNPGRAGILLQNRPIEFSMEQWLEFLEDAGVWQNLLSDEDALITWVRARLAEKDRKSRSFSPRMLAAIELLGTKLAGTQIEIDILEFPLEYLDALCAAGVTWTEVGFYPQWQWDNWVAQEQHSRDLESIASDPVLSKCAALRLDAKFIQANLDLLCEVSGARNLLAQYLDSIADLVINAQGSLTELSWIFEERLKDLGIPLLVEVNPAAMDKILSYDPAAALTWSIRAGTFAELTWQVFEESVSRLKELSPESKIKLLGTFPDLVVNCGKYFELIDAHNVRTRGELPDEVEERLATAYSIDDDVAFCSYSSGPPLVYWNGDTVEVSTADLSVTFRGNDQMSFPYAGGRLTAAGLVTVGSLDLKTYCGGLVCSLHDDRIFRFDRERTAQWLSEEQRFSDPIDVHEVVDALGVADLGVNLDNPSEIQPSIFPVFPETKGSLAGNINGKHVRIISRHDEIHQVVTPLGVFESPAKFKQVLARPGGGYWLTDWKQLRDASSDLCLSIYGGNLVYMLDGIDHLHHLRPRDEAASVKMRNCNVASAQVLLGAVEPNMERKVAGQSILSGSYPSDVEQVDAEPGTSVWSAAADFLDSEDPVLVSAVVNMAEDAVALGRMWDSLRESLVTPVKEPIEPVIEDFEPETSILLMDLIGVRMHKSRRSVLDFFGHVKEILENPGEQATGLLYGQFSALSIMGSERELLGRIAAPKLNPLSIRPIIGIFRELVSMGILCGKWRIVSVRCDKRLWKQGDWVEGSFAISGEVGRRVFSGSFLTQDDIQEVAGVPVYENMGGQISAAEFLSALTALEKRLDSGVVPDISDGVSQLLSGTTLPEEACIYLAGGPVLFRGSPDSPASIAHRDALGLKLGEFRAARQRLISVRPDLMSEMIVASVPENPAEIAAGLDYPAMAAVWRSRTNDAGHRITKQERTALERAVDSRDSAEVEKILRPLIFEDDFYRARYEFVAPLLTLAALRRSDDPIRPFIAEQFDRLRDHIDQWSVDQDFVQSISICELGAEFSVIKDDREVHALRVLSEGHLDGLIADLRTTYESPPGHPFDPMVSAPEVVESVMSSLNVPQDAARYFLQVLTLTTPSDALVREWNAWQKKEIDQAAAPLTELGVLEVGKRPGAGRTRFLPGGWLDSIVSEKGMEVWKAPLYLLWEDARMRPVVKSCPPLVPMPQLFSRAWERYKSGDVPQFEELK
ncbi:hypothetical protein [Corynebacterium glutamicum]|uniref:hypothetical protein n=1 Tax=Corynebacterium glutamicum TaxID=1718 RepID=UPI0007C6110A|nr:hypothetical protein [Corynebacterium glutamicum]ANE09283.1 hypothetical protein A3654_13490 [Corynebacterium glutamicum]